MNLKIESFLYSNVEILVLMIRINGGDCNNGSLLILYCKMLLINMWVFLYCLYWSK